MDAASLETLLPLTRLDAVALGLLGLSWLATTVVIERAGGRRASVAQLMADYRREWMRNVVSRDPRVFDSMIVSDLRQGTAFFASSTMLALGGGIALVGNVEQLAALAADLPLGAAEAVIWEIKLIVVLVFVANAFLKFVWAHRVFGYCAVMMGAIPNDSADPLALHRADQAAEPNISAARAFNRGLRSVYFALGALAWLLGAVPLMAATALTVWVLCRREFRSHTRATLVRGPAPARPADALTR